MSYFQIALAAFSYVGAMAGTAAVDRVLDGFTVIAASDEAAAESVAEPDGRQADDG